MSVDTSSLLSLIKVATSGLSAQKLNFEVIAHNLANINTTGFKRNRAAFQEVLDESIAADQTASADLVTASPTGRGVKLAAIQTSFSQGVIEAVENPLSLAIQGEGFFRLEWPDGSLAYTRDGTFYPDSKGQLVNAEGLKLVPSISVSTLVERIHVNPDGRILAKLAGEEEMRELGRVTLSRFSNPQGLHDLGQGLYRPTEASGEAQDGTPGRDGLGEIVCSAQEYSNVHLVDEMLTMTLAQRAYSLCARSLEILDQLLAEFTQGV